VGDPDQCAKRVLREETARATGDRVAFEVPPEVPVGALQPDGVVRVIRAPGLDALPAPWSRLRVDATVELKMRGDHTDRAAFARGELRRQARWVRRLEALRAEESSRDDVPTPDARDHATWFVAPHLPRWLADDAASGLLSLALVAPGCWHVGVGLHETLWIVANELPLHPSLIPFLIARTGRAFVVFARWALRVKSPRWVVAVIKELNMGIDMGREIQRELDVVEDDPALVTQFAEELAAAHPEVANKYIAKGIERGIERGIAKGIERGIERGIAKGIAPLLSLIARKLRRPLADADRRAVATRLDLVGPERLADVVLDLDGDALAAWLADPNAT
jgi:hypothetical protein